MSRRELKSLGAISHVAAMAVHQDEVDLVKQKQKRVDELCQQSLEHLALQYLNTISTEIQSSVDSNLKYVTGDCELRTSVT